MPTAWGRPKQGGIDFADDGSTITVTPVVNRGDSVSSVSFEMPGNVGTRVMKGTTSVQRQQSFSAVTISNASSRDLKLSYINVYNPDGDVQVNQTLGIDSNALIVNQLDAAPGATVIDIQNTQSVVVSADLENPFGSTTITAATGNIVRVGEDDEINTATLKLEAKRGNIGTSASNNLGRIESKSPTVAGSTDVTLIATGNIYHQHSQGSVDVTNISATTGDVDVFTVGDLFEDDGDGDNSLDVDPSVALVTGRKIKLAARRVGQIGNPIEINTSTAEAALTAFAANGIYLKELTDSISVNQLGASHGNIEFSMADAPGSGESFSLTANNGRISANKGSVKLDLPDDANFPVGGQFSLQNGLTINLDVQPLAGDSGASLLFDVPAIGAATAIINTGPDADTLDIRQLNTPTTITTGAGNDQIKLSSNANRLNLVRAETRINTGAGADKLIFDAGGGSPSGMTGSVVASPTNGYTSRLGGFEIATQVDFVNAEQVDLKLGVGNDEATIEIVDDTSVLSVFAGAGDDRVTVGSVAAGVNHIQGRVNVGGGAGGDDQLKVNDAANLMTKIGKLSARTITGLGMGEASEGIRYDLFESLTLDLGTTNRNTGTGDYRLQVSSLSTPTTINLGVGADSIRVGDNLFGIDKPLTIHGGTGPMANDQLTIASTTTTSLDVNATTIAGRELGGAITYSELENVRLELSNSPDEVTVTDTGAKLSILAKDGADDVRISNVSHATSIDLGNDTDADEVRVLNASSAITVWGDRRAIDRVDADLRSLQTAMNVRIEDSTLADTYEITGATTGKISATGVTDLLLRLGQGNDTAVLDTAKHSSSMGPNNNGNNVPNPPTEFVLDGGIGLDDFRVTSLDGLTVVRGGGDDDSITVPIAGVPNSTEFNHLRLDIEQLVIDNTSNSSPVAWNLSDLSLSADPIVSSNPSGNPVVVVGTGGVDRTKILGGTASDTLDVVTTTITDTFGEIDLDSADADSFDRVSLDFGGDVFAPNQTTTLRRSALNVDFDSIGSASQAFKSGDLTIATTGALIPVSLAPNSTAVRANSSGDTMSLEVDRGKLFRPTFFDIRATSGSSTRTIALTGTLSDGTTQTRNLTFNEGQAFAAVAAPVFRAPVSKITWTMGIDVEIRSVDYAAQDSITFSGPKVSNTYTENGLLFSVDGSLQTVSPDSVLTNVLAVSEQVNQRTRLRIANDTQFSVKAVRIKDTLREGNLSVDSVGDSFYSIRFTGGTDYQDVLLSTGNTTFFDISTLPNQIIDSVVVNDGSGDITLEFAGLMDGDVEYQESGFAITNDTQDPVVFGMRLVDGGVTENVSNTVTITSVDGTPFDLDSIGVVGLNDGRPVANEFIDFVGNVSGGGTVSQRVNAPTGQGLQFASLNGFTNLDSMTFRLQGEYSDYQVIDAITKPAQNSKLSFENLASQVQNYREDGIEISTTQAFVGGFTGGPSVGTATPSEKVTIRPGQVVRPASASPPTAQYSLSSTGGSPAAIRTVGGWDGDYVRLTHAGGGTHTGVYASDQVLEPWTGIAEYAFDLRTDAPNGEDNAEGWGWALLNISNFASGNSTTGFGPEPNFTGSLGVGFDSQDATDKGPNSVSIHFDGVELTAEQLVSGRSGKAFEIGNPMRAGIKIRPDGNVGSKVTVTLVDLVTREVMTPITDYHIPELAPYKGRVQISAATSGSGFNHDIDNVVYQYDMVADNGMDVPTKPVVTVDDFRTTEAVSASTINNSAMALYSLDVTAASTGPYTIDFDVTYLNGVKEQIRKSFTVAQANRFQTISFPELNRYLSQVQFQLTSGLRIDNVVAVASKQTVMDFGEFLREQGAPTFQGDRINLAGMTLSALENVADDGLLALEGRVRTNGSGITATLKADNGTSFSVTEIDFYNGTELPGSITFVATTANGSTIRETVTVPKGSRSTRALTGLTDIASVDFVSDDVEIENIYISQALVTDVPASVMPAPVPAITDRNTPLNVVLHTGDQLNAPTADDAATLSVDGSVVNSFNGTPFTIDYLNRFGHVTNPVAGERYIARFNFAGDFYIPANSTITVTGANPLAINVANDAFIGSNVTIDVSGNNAQSWTSSNAPAGGQGLAGGGDGGSGGDGAAGGSGGRGGRGGAGGAGGKITSETIGPIEILTRNPGVAGSPSQAGARGTSGGFGTNGIRGGDGFANSGGRAGFGGVGGGAGFSDSRVTFSGGIFGGLNNDTTGASGQGGNRENKGNPLLPGYYSPVAGNPFSADFGRQGGAGTDGQGGFNRGTGLLITAGSGGGGAGGGGGGGGGAGGIGGSGGGGGGAGFVEVASTAVSKDPGGDGGGGGGGGVGGTGGAGAGGGPGGGGGGAFELIAGGVLQVANHVTLAAKGGQGGYGTPGTGGSGANSNLAGAGGGTGSSATGQPNGSDGANGSSAGQPGSGGEASLGGLGAPGGSGGASGGDGGDGGNGQDGGVGGSGGLGGAGGGGAGGSIKLAGTVLNVDSSAIVDVSGGLSAIGNSLSTSDPRHGSGGRILLGGNTDLKTDLNNVVTSVGGEPQFANKVGDEDNAADYFTITQANPFVVDANANAVSTPRIEGLIGGASQYGFIDGISDANLGSGFKLSTAIDFDLSVANGVFQSAPSDALAALYRVKIGPEQLFGKDLDGDGDTTDDDYTGFDMLLFVNLTDINLAAPRLSVQVGDAAPAPTHPLTFQGVGDSAPVELTALNAKTIWATLVPEGDLTISASIAGTTVSGASGLTAGYLKDVDGLIDADEALYIKATRPNLDEFGTEGIKVDFSNLAVVENSIDDSEVYAISQDRQALIVVDRLDLTIKQVLENLRDDVQGIKLTGMQQIHSNPDGRFVYVVGDNGDMGIFNRNLETGVLTFQEIQVFDDVKSSAFVQEPEVVGIEFQQTYLASIDDNVPGRFQTNRDNLTVVVNERGGPFGDQWIARTYVRDAATGTFRRATAADIAGGGLPEARRLGLATHTASLSTALFVAKQNGDIEVMRAERTAANHLGVRQTLTNNELSFGAISNLESTAVAGSRYLHVISNSSDRVTTLREVPVNVKQTYLLHEQIDNGKDGVIGMDGPTDITVSSAGDFLYITNDSGTVSVFERNAPAERAQFVQVVRQNVSGFDGLDRPASIAAAGEGAIVATAGQPNQPASLVRLDAKPIVGGTLVRRYNFDSNNVLVVLEEPFPDEPGRLSSFSYYLPTTSIVDLPPVVTPLLLEKSGVDWKIVGIGRASEIAGPDLHNASFNLVSGSAETSGRYFGFAVDIYGESEGVTYADSSTESAVVFSMPNSLAVDQVLTGGTQTTRDYSMQAATLQRVKTGAVIVDFENIEALGVSTGGGSGVLTLRDATGTDVASTTILAGGGNDDVQVFDLNANTMIDLGGGDDTSLINTTSSGELIIRGGQGQDEIDLRDIGANSTATLSGGTERDQFNIRGDNLEAGNSTSIDGGSPDAIFPGDGLLFDPNGLGVTNNNPQPGSGTVGAVGRGPVNYVGIEDIQQVGAPVITFDTSQLTIAEGDPLALTITVDYAGHAPIGDVEWDLDNDGNFDEPEEPNGLTQNVTWEQLFAVAGINDDGLYTIAVRATNSVGTTTRFRTLTVTDTIPTVGAIPSMPISVGEEFSIPLSATDPGDDNVIGWEILWEVDPADPGKNITTKLGPDAKSASYTFNRSTQDLIIINVFDDEYGPDTPAGQLAWRYDADITTVPTSGPYTIQEGQDLSLSATPYGNPTTAAWTFSDGTPLLSAASGVVPWSSLESVLPSGVSGNNYTLHATATYAADVTSTTTLKIENVAPTATLSGSGPVNEGSAVGSATVSFTNQFDPSSNDTADGFTYDFFFGDDPSYDVIGVSTPTVNVPAALLAEDGTLDIRGVIKDRDGGTNAYQTSIQILEVAPNITFQASTNQADEGVEVTFTASVTDPGNETLDQIVIDWGDGDVEPIANLNGPIRHRFADDGNQIVKLSVWSDGREYTSQLNIQVNNVAPVVSNLNATPLVEGQRVVVTGDVIDAGVGDSSIVIIEFGNGLARPIQLPVGETRFETYVTYPDEGNYDIKVTATDDEGASSTEVILPVVIANATPTITLNPGSEEIFESKSWTLRGVIDDSGASDRYDITIDWDDPQGPGTTVLTNQGQNFEASYIYADDRTQSGGKYQVTVTVVDVNDPTSRSTKVIDVDVINFAPEIVELDHNASDPANPIASGQTVTLNGLFTELGTQDTVQGFVDWGDGSPEQNLILSNTSPDGGTFTQSHTYNADGSYIIKVRLTDEDGGLTVFESFAFVGQVDSTSPTADIVDVTPDPRSEPAGVIEINFNESVRGFDVSDLSLFRDGILVDTSGLTLSEASPSRYTVDLSAATTVDGFYELRVDSARSNITDLAGNAVANDAVDSFYKGVAPAKVESIVYDDGMGQRSVVRSITITFDALVTVDPGAFRVTTKDGRPVSVSASLTTQNGKTQARLTFTGPDVDASGSLLDGNYRLTILDTHVRDQRGRALDGNADQVAGGNSIDDFFRLLGDSDGDRDVDGIDFLALRATYRQTSAGAAFDQAFDFDADNDVDGQDFLKFREAFRTRLEP